MTYIVKNCPAYRAGMNLPHYCKAVGCCINTYVGATKNLDEAVLMRDKYLQLFDIEEINK